MMKKYLLLFILLLASCSEDKKPVAGDEENSSTSTSAVKTVPKPTVKVQVGWKIPVEPSGVFYEYVDVNPTLAQNILRVVDGDAETLETLPKLKQPRLKVGEQVYRLYPHTLINEQEMKSYKIENVYKDLYRDWLKHIGQKK
jgi:hypothetical protein